MPLNLVENAELRNAKLKMMVEVNYLLANRKVSRHIAQERMLLTKSPLQLK